MQMRAPLIEGDTSTSKGVGESALLSRLDPGSLPFEDADLQVLPRLRRSVLLVSIAGNCGVQLKLNANCTSVATGCFQNSRERFRMHPLLSEIKTAISQRNRDGAGILPSVEGTRQKCDQRGSNDGRKPEQGDHPPAFDSACRSFDRNDRLLASFWSPNRK